MGTITQSIGKYWTPSNWFGGHPDTAAPPPPAPPPPPPQLQQPTQTQAAAAAMRSAGAAAGSASTIKTSGLGVNLRSKLGVTSLIGQ